MLVIAMEAIELAPLAIVEMANAASGWPR